MLSSKAAVMPTKRPLTSTHNIRFERPQMRSQSYDIKRTNLYENFVAEQRQPSNPLRCQHQQQAQQQSCLRIRGYPGPTVVSTTTTTIRENRSSSAGSKKSLRGVQFLPYVSVKHIPSHREYSEITRRSMWSSLKEIRTNARRNEAEYMFDGCDWKNASEEDSMYFDEKRSALVHPVHVETVYMFDGMDWQKVVGSANNNNTEHSKTINNTNNSNKQYQEAIHLHKRHGDKLHPMRLLSSISS